MNYRYTLIILLLILNSCTTIYDKNIVEYSNLEKFSNTGFAFIYNEDYEFKKKLDDKSLVIFHDKLENNVKVKIVNPVNNKSVVCTVINNKNYPSFYNSVITSRVVKEIDLDKNEPYLQIKLLNLSTAFIAKKAKTYKAEKKVATSAPVDEITINDLSKINKQKKRKKNKKKKFNYIIKIVDFYYMDTAKEMVKKIKNKTKVNNVKILKISNKIHRVYTGPFSNLNSLKKSYDDIRILNFDNIEILKNN